jgi:Lipocalin-like domain
MEGVMSKSNLVVVSGMVVALCIASNAIAQTAKDLVGTWQNVSNQTIHPDGKRTDNFGPKGTGMLIFGADGRFVVVNINPDTPKFASNNRGQGTPEENKAAVLGSVGLYGTYTLAGKVLTMNVAGSTYPNWTGTVQTRNIASITSDELKWTLAGSLGGTSELVFKRVK